MCYWHRLNVGSYMRAHDWGNFRTKPDKFENATFSFRIQAFRPQTIKRRFGNRKPNLLKTLSKVGSISAALSDPVSKVNEFENAG